jgi:hypothetical protein
MSLQPKLISIPVAPSVIVDFWLLTVDGRVKKMKIARIICWPLDSTLRPTVEARIWYHSGLTAGIDIKAAGDRTFSPVLHSNIGDVPNYRCFLYDVLQ